MKCGWAETLVLRVDISTVLLRTCWLVTAIVPSQAEATARWDFPGKRVIRSTIAPPMIVGISG